MKGAYSEYTGSDGTVYPACIIADATACCSQGIEFNLKDDKYPKDGDEITVHGVFKSYVDKADGQTYYHLVNSVLE